MTPTSPSTTDSIVVLGSYGTGVLAIANRESGAVPVDGNIARVLSRCHGLSFERGEPRKKPEIRQAMSQIIQAYEPESRLGLLYALVDLGALACSPRQPKCSDCPLAAGCAFARRGTAPCGDVCTADAPDYPDVPTRHHR